VSWLKSFLCRSQPLHKETKKLRQEMKFVACLFLCAAAGANASVDSKGHPIGKVIGLLKGLKEKAVNEGKAEEYAYAKFAYWCKTSTSEIKSAIKDEKENIDELSDTIAGKKKEMTSLNGKIAKLQDQIGKKDLSLAEQRKARGQESDLYKLSVKEMGSTVKALGAAIKAVVGAQGSTEPKLLLAQDHVRGLVALVSLTATEEEVKTLADFSGRPTLKAKGDRKKHVDKYKFKSGNVIELLKKLQIKFQDEKLAATIAETNALNAASLSKEALKLALKAAKKSQSKKALELASTSKDKAQAKGEKKDEKEDLKADSKRKETTQEACARRKLEWAERSETRSMEISAMDTAIVILAKATGVRTKAPGNPVLPTSPVDFFQVSQTGGDPKMKAVVLLRAAAREAHSRALERLAMEVSAHLNGPFDNVNQMIQKMIFRLMNEQKNEDEHKLWCDKELSMSNSMKTDKTDKIKNLNANIKVENAAVAKLTEDIKNAAKTMSDISTFMKEATEIRNTGKSENNLAIKDSKEAQAAIANAVGVLEAFYKESGSIKKEKWEFIQESNKGPVKLSKNPALWDSPYNGVSDPKNQPNGIVTVLENIATQFSKMQGETQAQEQVDQKEYENAMKANKIEQSRRSKESEMKSAEKSRKIGSLVRLQAAKKATSAQLEKTQQYLKDLSPACVDGGSTYGARKANRTKEIVALRKAQSTLTDAFKGKKGASFLQML